MQNQQVWWDASRHAVTVNRPKNSLCAARCFVVFCTAEPGKVQELSCTQQWRFCLS